MSGVDSVSEDERRTPDTWGGEAPAYPWGDVTNGGVMGGLTKRELFAAMAMQALVGNENWELNHVPKQTATEAVEYADALLKELARG